MDVSRRGNTRGACDKFANSLNIEREFCRQQMPQRVGDSVLTFTRRKLQDLHVHFVGHLHRMSTPQSVPCDPENAGRKHFFAVVVVGEGTWFANQ